MKLSKQEKAKFQETGILKLNGFVPKAKVKLARESLMQELERLKIREKGKWHSKRFESSAFKITTLLSQHFRSQNLYADLISKDLLACMSELAASKLRHEHSQTQVLFTLPQKQQWSVPYLGWHLDIASPSSDFMPGVQAFIILDELASQGGGTVAIAGSHRILQAQNVKAGNPLKVLREDSYWQGLFSSNGSDRERFFKPALLSGVELFVVEMTGKAGDVYLMDMRIVHAPAPNTSKNARMMVTGRFLVPDYKGA